MSGYFTYVTLEKLTNITVQVAESSVEAGITANESCYVKWLCKRWSGLQLMVLMLRNMTLQISLMLTRNWNTGI